MHRGGNRVAGAAAFAVLALSSSPLFAAAFAEASAAEQDQQKLIEDERRREMNQRPPLDPELHQTWLWDAGGWLHLQFDQLDDEPLRDTRTDRYVDLRLWGEIRYERNYSLSCRIRTA